MASQLTEHWFTTPRPGPPTPAGDRSPRGGSEITPFLQDSYGSHQITTHCPLTADTTDQSRFRTFGIIYARYNRVLHTRPPRGFILPVSGLALGAAAWRGHLALIPLSLLVLLFFGQLQTRRQVFGLTVAYYAGATWQVVPGAAAFFGYHNNRIQVLLLWLSVSLLLALPWTTLWSPKRVTRLYTVPIAIILMAIPPLGLIGVASPLTTAGILFPGLAWFGIFLMLLLCALLASYPLAGLGIAIVLSSPIQLLYRAPKQPSDWQAVSTHFGGVGLDTPSPIAEYVAAESIKETALLSPARVIVFPEAVVSNWNEATDAFWAPALEILKRHGKTILIGSNVSDTHSSHYFNSIVIRGAERHSDFLQRIPIPFTMWKPGSGRGVPLQLVGPGTLEVAGQKAAVLICYEQLLIWPAISSFEENPTILLGLANNYWAQSTSVSEIQRACLTSWARLFSVPMLWAENT